MLWFLKYYGFLVDSLTVVMSVNWFIVNLFQFVDFCINRLIVMVLLFLASGLKRESS